MSLLPQTPARQNWNVANMDSRYLFDSRGEVADVDVDLSDEMEEMRESLYSLLQTEFPAGVVAHHLEKVYKQRYPEGPHLAPNWLDQLTEEFEVERRGALVMVFARLRKQKTAVFHSPAVVSERSFCEGSNSFIETNRAEMKEAQITWDRNMTFSMLSATELAQETRAVSVDVGVDARTYQALVTSTLGPSTFYVRLFDNELTYDRMRKVMADNYADSVTRPLASSAGGQTENMMKPLSLEEINVEGLYVAWMESASDWHRVVVKEKRPQQNAVYALFIDHGDSEELPANRLRRITPDLVDPQQSPVFALHCSLYDCPGGKADDVAVLFNEMVFISHQGVSQARKLTARFISETADATYRVDLYTEDGKNISQTMKAALDARNADEHPMSMSTPVRQSPPTSRVETTTTTTPSSQKELSFEFGTPKSERFGEGRPTSDGVVTQLALKPMDVPATESFPAYVLFAPDPDDFSIQWKGFDPVPDYLQGLVRTESEKQPPIGANESIHPGHFYAARVTDLTTSEERVDWQRVYVSGVAKMDGYFKVFLVDRGSFSVVHRDDIRPLTAAAFAIPDMFIIKCKLAGVKPADGTDFWSPTAQRAFSERVCRVSKKGLQTLKVVRIGTGAGVWSTADAPGLPLLKVQLIDETDKTDIAQWLVKEGHAIAC
uniref:Tudor domain-containing protein n=1 Tax=Plectus sambesii TaxID=2011161 RepID=A0A914X0M3_9BILA